MSVLAKGGLAVRRINVKRRRGFTLSELCIVLALVAIAGTIVTSFCLVVHRRSVISRARLDIVNEINVVETYVERWVDKMYENGAKFSINEGVLTATIGTVDYKATFTDGVFNGALPDAEPMTYTTMRIESLTFDFESKNEGADGTENEGKGDKIFFCTATALLPQVNGEDKQEQYTFCVNSRIGESFEEVTTG